MVQVFLKLDTLGVINIMEIKCSQPFIFSWLSCDIPVKSVLKIEEEAKQNEIFKIICESTCSEKLIKINKFLAIQYLII